MSVDCNPATNNNLNQIMSRYTLDAKKIDKIESYIAKCRASYPAGEFCSLFHAFF